VPISESERVGLAIVRCWTESRCRSGFRARITVVEDLTTGAEMHQITADPEQAIAAVADLIRRFTYD
jgi:hypothetical protein